MSVAVIIPSFNRCVLLKRALVSVFKQDCPADEVIVVDDGSTDDSAEMVKRCFPEVVYIYQDNCGVSSARNKGIAKSRSEWITFLDSDDEWLPGKLAVQRDYLSRNDDYRVCHTEEIWIRDGRRVNPMKKHAKKGGWIFQHCLPLCAMSPSSVMIHRQIFSEVGDFDEDLPACEDYDLWLRITARYPVLFITEPMILKYGGHSDQLSRRFWGMDRFRIKALEKIIAEPCLSEENRSAAIAMLQEKARVYIQGAQKRGKADEVAQYQLLMNHYQA